MKPTVSVSRNSNRNELEKNIKTLSKKAVYVGIPASSSEDRTRQLIKMAREISGTRGVGKIKQKNILKLTTAAISNKVNNAQLLYIHSKGSPINNIPARPVIEPAIQATGNKEAIAYELSKAVSASMEGKPSLMFLKRAGIAAQNASKAWFTDSRNNWAPNKAATIKAKGSDKPLIDTGALRQAITYVVEDE